jgi:hypothetical protein
MFDKNDKKKTITPIIQKRMQYLRDKHIRNRGNNLNFVIDTTKLYYNRQMYAKNNTKLASMQICATIDTK